MIRATNNHPRVYMFVLSTICPNIGGKQTAPNEANVIDMPVAMPEIDFAVTSYVAFIHIPLKPFE